MKFDLNIRFLFAMLIFTGSVVYAQKKQNLPADKNIILEFNQNGISRISSHQDPYNANVVSSGDEWGMSGLYEIGEGDWLNFYTRETRNERLKDNVVYDFIEGMPLKMVRSFQEDTTGLDWNIRIQNMSRFSITTGDLYIPFPWTSTGGICPNVILRNFSPNIIILIVMLLSSISPDPPENLHI